MEIALDKIVIIIIINNLPDGIDSELKTFAGDIKVYRDVKWTNIFYKKTSTN